MTSSVPVPASISPVPSTSSAFRLPFPKLDPEDDVAKGISVDVAPDLELTAIAERRGVEGREPGVGFEVEVEVEVDIEVGRGGTRTETGAVNSASTVPVLVLGVTFRSGEDGLEEGTEPEASLSLVLPLGLPLILLFLEFERRSSPFPPREEDELREGEMMIPATMQPF